MKRDYRIVPSPALGHGLEMLVYGTAGKPMLVFPSQEGRFFDYENFGMIEVLAPFINKGLIQVYCVDSNDKETWFSDCDAHDKMLRAKDYENALISSVVPHILSDGHKDAGILLHGCSFGAFHTALFAMKYPEYFDSAIALSGAYDISFTLNRPIREITEAFNPISMSSFLPSATRKQLKNSLFVICSGQGPWEEWNHEAESLTNSLKSIGANAMLDLWGYDVSHDWPWWKKMIVYFLGKFERSGFLHSDNRISEEDSSSFIKNFAEL